MKRIVLILLSFLVCQFSTKTNAEVTFLISGCRSTDLKYTKGGEYKRNLDIVFSKFTSKSSSLKFYNYTIGVTFSQVYGLYQCRDDLSLVNCNACVKNATLTIAQECPLAIEGIVWYEECMLRYANSDIFSFYETFPQASKWNSTMNVSNFDEFSPIFDSTMNELIEKASSSSSRFASGKTNLSTSDQLYSFAQCTPDLSTFGCSNCLKSALTEMTSCCNASSYVMIVFPSCQLWYDTTGPFLKDQSSEA